MARFTLILLAVLLIGLPCASEVTSQNVAAVNREPELAVVVNPSNSLDTLPLRILRRMLFGEDLLWPNNRRVTIVLQESGNALFETALRIVLTMPRGDYKRRILLARYQGNEVVNLKILPTAELVARYVSADPAAIGILESTALEDAGAIKRLQVRVTEQIDRRPPLPPR